ncbi:MAG: hypothetical protein SF070_12975 [Gemmatimonadota bacterium]|nr:hypothetical protein [Gemmatimonadota bacterium]
MFDRVAQYLRGLLDRLRKARRRSGAGVRAAGRASYLITIGRRSYWVHARPDNQDAPGCVVWTSDARDITDAPTIIAAPPAAPAALPEIRRRLAAYFEAAGIRMIER